MTDSSPLIPPSPVTDIDLEAAPSQQIQCRICLETDGRHFIAPCKCRGTSKYVHRECLDHWRAVKEGFAFAHCTTCKAPYHLRVLDAYRKWRTFKFCFFVTRDILFIFLAVQLVIAALAYLAYLIDGYQHYRLRLVWGFDHVLSFYYICGALLFFVLLGLSGCFLTCSDERVRNDLGQPCREIYLCCCQPGVLVATMVAQRIWQRHYHILAKRMLTKVPLAYFFVFCAFGSTIDSLQLLSQLKYLAEYVVEDIDGEITGSDWSPPSIPPEHVQHLKTLGLL
ncbi:hypothetical protein ACSQ67_004680 [Phaseolus vulgaris]